MYVFCVDQTGDRPRRLQPAGRIKGRFILSINDTPGAPATFARFHVATAETTYTVGASAAQRAGELIVFNFTIG